MKLHLFLITLFAFSAVNAQTNTDWKAYKKQDGLIISYKIADCDMEMGYDEQRILFKIENNSGKKALVIWQYEQYYNGICRTCNDPNGEYRKEFSIEPGIVLEGKCSVYDYSGLMIFSQWVSQPNKENLTKWNLGNLTIKFY